MGKPRSYRRKPMVVLSERPDPKVIEPEARAIWKARRLPPEAGPVGPGQGPVVHQFEGSFAPQEPGMLTAQRAVAADVDARALILSGRRALGILRKEEGGPSAPDPKVETLIAALGVWVGGFDGRGWDSAPRRAEVQTLVGRLAHLGALAVRDVSLRICPACAVTRDPERIVYQEESGDTLLVRFPFTAGERTVSALVWTDAAWRLLGTSALMVHPDLPYVVARYTRRGTEEFVFTSKSSIDRIRGWLPGAELEVLEEHPGKYWEGQVYVHPLRHEFPMGGGMEPPGGTILPVSDVGDSGTGVVPLVPGHGGTDALIAERLGVPGWPLITPKGRFDILLVHKYAGLELESGSEFVSRDLAESGAIFAHLRVRRGVPHCSRCGTALIWAPGRAWCLEPSRLPDEKVAVYRTLLPRDRPIEKLEAVPWPISEPMKSDDPHAISLLECTSCDRLESLGREAERCACGGRRRAVRRRLLPAFDGAASAWVQVDPFPAADTARLYVNERRRAPAVVHHVAAMSGVGGTVGEVRLSVLPTVPESDLPALVERYGADTVRLALVRAQASEGDTATLPERCEQERRRLDQFWATVRASLGPIDSLALSTYSQPIVGAFGDLEPEDRALLARFERLRVQCLAEYERAEPALVHRRLFHFLENDLRVYRNWVAPRLGLAGSPPSKRAALRTLVHVIAGTTLLLGPIAPHLAESVHRVLRRERASLFEESVAGVDRTLLDDTRAKAWDRWAGVVRSVDRFRRQLRLPPDAPIPSVALVLDSDAAADEYRAEAPTIERLARVQKIEVGSPAATWAGRRRQLRPVEAEIQRVYPSRAAQIIHLLRRMPERKWADPSSGQEFSMMVNGQPTQILPSMVAWSETLPERYVPVEWSPGELYAEVPASLGLPTAPPPPLSPDAFRLVDRVAQRLRSEPHPSPVAVVVAASGPLAAELSAVTLPLAAHLKVQEFRLVASDRELPRHGRGFGRTKAGTAWAFHVGGVALPSRAAKVRPAHPHGPRVRPAFTPGELAPTVTNYADEGLIAESAAIRSLGEELDQILGAPMLGPTKVATAWAAGLRSVEAYRQAPWVTLVALPGFGVSVATALVTQLGGTVPPRPPPERRRVRREPAGDLSPEGSSAQPHWVEPIGPSNARPPPRTAPSPPALPTPPLSPAPPSSSGAPPAPDAAPVPPPPPLSEVSEDEPTSIPTDTATPAVPPEEPIALPPTSGPPPTDAPAEASSATEIQEAPPLDPFLPGEESEPTPSTEPDEPVPTPVNVLPAPPNDDSLDDADLIPEVEAPTVVPQITGDPALLAEEASTAPSSGDGVSATPEIVPPEESANADPGDVGPDNAPPIGLVDDLPDTARQVAPVDPEAPAPAPAESAPEADPTPPAEVEAGPILEDAPPPPTLTADEPRTETTLVPDDSTTEAIDPSAATPDLESPVLEASASAPVVDPLPAPSVSEAVPPPVPAFRSEAATPEPAPLPPAVPPALASSEAAEPPTPPSGGVEVIVDVSYLTSLERFLEATAAGHQGICVVRDSPERVRAYIGSRPVEIRWLTNIGRGPTLKPTDLDGFAAFLAHAVSSGRVTAFFLEGVEYLVRLHGLEKVVDRMQVFDQLARAQSARVWVPLNPRLLSPEELERFVSVFGGRPTSS
jgi:hypothetical protein